ncbi:unnamed protein product [Dicrocoelium dendriticum]|nr:unnamed protein product [Dicrocoelium dendriticum]
MSARLLLLVSIAGLAQAWYNAAWTGPKSLTSQTEPVEKCGECDLTKCVAPKECKAGLARDKCDCCPVCALEESHLCNLDQDVLAVRNGLPPVTWHGRCGQNLECRIRNDIDSALVGSQSICYCLEPGLVCGSDGITYSPCQLEAEKAISNGTVTKLSDGPCKTKPTVELKGPNGLVKNGDKLTLICEARAYPRADVTWHLSRLGDKGKSRQMPSDSEDITVSVRGGASQTQVTSYLQITNFKLDYEGEYSCMAENEFGTHVQSTSLILKN